MSFYDNYELEPPLVLTRYGIKDNTTGIFYPFTEESDEWYISLFENKKGGKDYEK